MKEYSIPQDMSEKDKIVGGILTMVQAFWIGIGFVSGLVVFFLIYGLTRSFIFSAILAIPFMGTGLPFAFYKKHELTLLQLIVKKQKHKKKNKHLKHFRNGVNEKW